MQNDELVSLCWWWIVWLAHLGIIRALQRSLCARIIRCLCCFLWVLLCFVSPLSQTGLQNLWKWKWFDYLILLCLIVESTSWALLVQRSAFLCFSDLIYSQQSHSYEIGNWIYFCWWKIFSCLVVTNDSLSFLFHFLGNSASSQRTR